MWLVFHPLRVEAPLVYLWPFAALQLGVMLPEWRSPLSRFTAQLAGLLGIFAGGSLVGLPVSFTLAIGFITAVDVWIAGSILSRSVRGFEDLKRRKNLLLFAVAAAVAPVATGLLMGTPLAAYLHLHLIKATVVVVLSDSLAIGVMVPAMLYLVTGEYRTLRKLRPHMVKGSSAAVLFLAVAGGDVLADE